MNWILVEVENVSCRSSWVLLFFKKTIIFKCVRNLCCYKPVKPNKKCVFVKVLVWRRKLSNGQSMFAKQQNIFFTLLCISYLYPYFPDAQYFSLSTIIEKSILIKYKNSPQFTLDSFCVQMKTKLRCMISKNEKSSCNKMTLFTFYDLNLIHFLVFETKSKCLIWMKCVNVYFQNKWLWKRLLSDHI